MPNHNTLLLTKEQHSSIVQAEHLLGFFIKLLDHNQVSVFELERESLVIGLQQTKELLTLSNTTKDKVRNNWRDVDAKLFETPWHGWVFKEGLLWDEDGNHYSPESIKMSWQADMIVNGKIGSKSDIRMLKEHLSNLNREPEVSSVTVVVNGKKVVFTPNVSS